MKGKTMKSVKSILAVILALSLVFALAACSNRGSGGIGGNVKEVELETTAVTYKGNAVRIASSSDTLCMSLINLLDEKIYDVSLTDSSEKTVKMLKNGEADIAVCPLFTAEKLFEETNSGIVMLGISSLSSLSVVSTNSEIKSLADLKDKTVYTAGKGEECEAVLSYIFEKNSMSDNVKIEYLDSFEKVSEKLIAGEAETAVLPEPYVSLALNSNASSSIVSDISLEWDKVESAAKLAFGCIIADAKYASENKEAIEQVIRSIRDSVEYVNVKSVEALGKFVEKTSSNEKIISTDEKSAEDLNKASVSRMNVVFVEGDMMKTIVSNNLSRLLPAEKAEAVGDEFYYIAG